MKIGGFNANLFKVSAAEVENIGTALDTEKGSVIAMANYGNGRVAVVGDGGLIYRSLSQDPSAGGAGRAVFNLMSWLSGENRTIDQRETMYVLSAAGSGQTNPKHAMFWEGLNSTVSSDEYADATTYQIPVEGDITYEKDLVDGQIDSADFDLFANARGLAEALTPVAPGPATTAWWCCRPTRRHRWLN